MPVRPATHQIETASRKKFAALIPDQWVVRDKGDDYGIDSEVEVFGADGKATGIIFYVQLRATDDPESANRLSISIDQLDYFYSLDLPVLIVRYCRSTDQTFYRWHFTIKPTEKQSSQKSITVHFDADSLWTDTTSEQLQRLMRIWRNLKRLSDTQTVLIDLRNCGADPNYFFEIESEIERFCSSCGALSTSSVTDRDELLIVQIEVKSESVFVSLLGLGSYTMEFDTGLGDNPAHFALYAVVALLRDLGIKSQAATAARQFASESIICSLRYVAAKACIALENHPSELLRLAIRNGLETETDIASAIITMALLHRTQVLPEAVSAYDDWLDAQATYVAHCADPQTYATWAYSKANNYIARGHWHLALTFYNKARKRFPDYWKTEYFPLEIAGCLFDSQKYSLARKIYMSAVKLGHDANLSLRLGDAHFYCGAFAEAEISYHDAFGIAGHTPLGLEARLKRFLSEQLAKMLAPNFKIQRHLAHQSMSKIDANDPQYTDILSDVWTTLNPIDSVCNFNLGVYRSARGELDQAMAHFLLSAFSSQGDLESWANAVICAFNIIDNLDMTFSDLFLVILTVALDREGMAVYKPLRSKLIEQGLPSQFSESLDDLVRGLRKPVSVLS